MKINLIEMEGLLRGQCIPSDLIVNETLAEYLVRQFGKLEQQLAAVVAENAGLKEFCKNAAFDADYEAELGMERGGFTDALNDIQTPATDAFLAEVRAQGVESLSDAVKSVIAERQRQQSVEGWTTARDDEYEHGELADAAGCYALSSELFDCVGEPPRQWPWPNEWWKPSMRRRDLVKAGALILAEIERLDRHELSSIQKGVQS